MRSDLTEFVFQPHCLVNQPASRDDLRRLPPHHPPALRVRTHITTANFLIRYWGSKSDHLPVPQTLTEPVPEPVPQSPFPPLPALLLRQSYSTVQVGLELCRSRLALNLRPLYFHRPSAEITDVRHHTTLMGAVALDRKPLLSRASVFPSLKWGDE